jgi:hypothetical protein
MSCTLVLTNMIMNILSSIYFRTYSLHVSAKLIKYTTNMIGIILGALHVEVSDISENKRKKHFLITWKHIIINPQ